MIFSSIFFFNDPAPTEIYTLSLHDALPILASINSFLSCVVVHSSRGLSPTYSSALSGPFGSDRKSTRLNSSHMSISYAVFCLKKKKDRFIEQTLNLPRSTRYHCFPKLSTCS